GRVRGNGFPPAAEEEQCGRITGGMGRGTEIATSPQKTGENAARDGERDRQRPLRARRRIARRHQIVENVEIILWWHACRVHSLGFFAADTAASVPFYPLQRRITRG